MTTMNVSIPEWVKDDIIGDVDNRSKRVTELLIKGYMYERQEDMDERVKSVVREVLEEKGGPAGIRVLWQLSSDAHEGSSHSKRSTDFLTQHILQSEALT